MPNKLHPIEEPYSKEVAGILSKYPQQNGYILKLFRLFANSTRFLLKGMPNLLDKESPLSMKQREIVILRVTANLNCEYEWGVHVAVFSSHVKLTTDQIAATKTKAANTDCWEDQEQILLQAVDDICSHHRILPATYERVCTSFSKEQQLEILALCGAYHTVSFIANTTELESESFGARFPKT
ncbi:carboxymuconolactone decarboxylase family protein [Kordiimonas aquimaris]|uniref:carboxymuconolactone decarboxylase family protein n=1 Tax=Kordiimonas aquimaris TaxID=707591 RepID=UPI0021D22C2B|nr:carboxymuconolactone decarboxylase family protein [Kordiimonas aquimaris]